MLKLNNYFDIKWLVLTVTFTSIVLALTHIPQEYMPSQLQKSGLDKLQHVVAYGTITFLLIFALKSSPSLLSALLVFFAILAIGIVDEVTQPIVGRQASIIDLAADAVGIAVGLLLSALSKRRFLKSRYGTTE
jgi:VanZ family protein